MKKDVYISIKGSQDYGSDGDSMELTTAGKFYDKDGKYYLSYVEGELTGLEKCTTTLKVEPCGVVTMMRYGQTNTHMIFEKGKCHIGHYETPYGDFTISVTANDINVSLDENGGNIDIDYIMDINNVSRSRNGISLTVRA
ncbi:MAG: DUF1934 domain-containing protein [Ruminococcaceae bacterium]|nr:DUF1934 domain-containing protein [Oscillospiraceae bacterium]